VAASLRGTLMHARDQIPEVFGGREIELREVCPSRRIEQVQPLIVLFQRIKMRIKLDRGGIQLAEHGGAGRHAKTTT
jgi:hypothetical protein